MRAIGQRCTIPPIREAEPEFAAFFRRHWFTGDPSTTAQQNRERDCTTQGRIEPMDLLFS